MDGKARARRPWSRIESLPLHLHTAQAKTPVLITRAQVPRGKENARPKPGVQVEAGLLAGAKFEVVDMRAPDEVTAGIEIFRGEPHSAIVYRVDTQAGV